MQLKPGTDIVSTEYLDITVRVSLNVKVCLVNPSLMQTTKKCIQDMLQSSMLKKIAMVIYQQQKNG